MARARRLSCPTFELEPIGRLAHPYGPNHFRGNRFHLVVRDLGDDDLRRATDEIAAISSDGLPNYFDDQRFGSVGFSRQFIGHAWLLGDHERALKLALADPNPFDRSEAKAQKALIREFWGRWPELKARLDRSSERSIVTYLVDHPTDYRGAFARLRRELRTLYFSAFQSHLWNLILAGWLECQTRNDQRVPVELKVGTFPFPRATRARSSPNLDRIADSSPQYTIRDPRRAVWEKWLARSSRAFNWSGLTCESST